MYASSFSVKVCWIFIFATFSGFSFFCGGICVFTFVCTVNATAHGNWHVDDTLFAVG